MKKKFTILMSFILIFVLGLSISVNAEDTIDSVNYIDYDDVLLNETNTYNGNIETKTREIYYDGKLPLEYQAPKYDMSQKNGNIVSDDEPQVTFITHGLNGSSGTWRIGDIFSGGVVDQLNQVALCDFYVGQVRREDDKADGKIGVVFNKITIKPNENKVTYGENLKDVEKSPRHYVIIFSASEYDVQKSGEEPVRIKTSSDINDKVYYEFNYMASVVIKQLKEFNPNHELPRINLIGHSRGGLTNLQFALDHPDLVESMYSLDTPYLGTTMSNIHRLVNNINFASGSIEFTIGEADIIDENTYNEYYNRWNENYESMYKNINVVALGSYCDLDFLIYSMLVYFGKDSGKTFTKDYYESLKLKIVAGVAVYLTLPPIIQVPLNIFLLNLLSPYIKDIFGVEYYEKEKDDIENVFNLLFDELEYSIADGKFEIYDDLCVDLDSQLGKDNYTNKEYKGFNTYVKSFDFDDVVDLDRVVAPNAPAVPHNLVPLDVELLGVIASNIRMNTKNSNGYIISESNNEVKIMRYIGNSQSNVLSIPSTINNKPVTMIANGAFSNLMNINSNITTIKIPSTIKIIEDRAFKNNDNLEKINFENNSQLTNIEKEAFANIPKLTEFTLPPNLSYLGNGVFKGDKLRTIVGNDKFIWQNNLLIGDDIVYYGNTANVSIPDNINMIAEYAFSDSDLTSIALNNVTNVGLYAFYNSNLTTITDYDKLDTISSSALVGTPWFKKNVNQDNGTLILGNVLLYMYSDAETLVIPSGVKRIISNSIVGVNIQNVIIPESVEYINGGAFNETPNLNSILFESTTPPNVTETSFASNVILYVKDGYLNTYLNNQIYKILPNEITAKPITLTFKDEDGNTIGVREEYYYSTFDNYLTSNIPLGKELDYFIDENGNIYRVNDILDSYNDLVLTVVLRDSVYHINLGDESSQNVSYGDNVNFGTPEKLGYNFIGWFTESGEQITDSSGKCVWTRTNLVENLHAEYEIVVYNLNLVSDKGEFLGSTNYTYTVEDPLRHDDLSDIKEFGYYFLGWYLEDNKFDTTYGFYEDLTLTAKWDGKHVSVSSSTSSYTIRDKVSIINFSPLSTSNYYTFTIASNVTHVSFIGDGHRYKVRIIIQSADTILGDSAIVLSLKDMNIYVPEGYSHYVIDAANRSTIINYSGTNTITGAKGANGYSGTNYYSQAEKNVIGTAGGNGGIGYDGIIAIKASIIHLYNDDSASKLTVTGGSGGNGGDGGKGQMGGNGLNPPSGSMFSPRKGDDGRQGGKGGNGGDGGDGAYAVSAAKITIEDFATCTLVGGAGGKGGSGGNGGTGGKGTDDVSANPFTGVGDPGNGGNGGYGGNGGDGGNGSDATDDKDVKGTGGAAGSGGSAGFGGNGGAGGKAGNAGEDGSDGSDGKDGLDGTSGEYGVKGSNSSGSSSGLAVHGNLFNDRFYKICKL